MIQDYRKLVQDRIRVNFFLLTESSTCGTVCLMMTCNAESTDMFETKLGKLRSSQEIFYDYHARIQGTRRQKGM